MKNKQIIRAFNEALNDRQPLTSDENLKEYLMCWSKDMGNEYATAFVYDKKGEYVGTIVFSPYTEEFRTSCDDVAEKQLDIFTKVDFKAVVKEIREKEAEGEYAKRIFPYSQEK